MKITISKALVVVFCILGLGFCCCQDAKAIITDAWLNGNSGIDGDGGTTFYMGFDFAEGVWAEQDSDFRCTLHGAGFTSSICDWDETWDSNDAIWNYYWVDLYPCVDGEQTIGGYIKTRRHYELKVYARANGSGAYLNGGNPIYTTSNWSGYSVSAISSRYNPTGYNFSNWGISASDMPRYTTTSNNRTRDITWKSLEWDTNLDAYYDLNIFEGQSIVYGDANATAGYAHTNTSVVGYINNCSPTSGCRVSFAHNMRRASGSSGSVSYRVSRSSNMVVSTRAIAANSNVKSGSSGNPGGERVSTSGEWVLYPGMVVCERLTFKAYSVPGTGDTYTQVCASALGNAQPDDPGNPDEAEDPGNMSGDISYINIKVRNESVDRYKNYQREVYAKPTDKLWYRATYNPVLQYSFYLNPQQMRINGGTIYNGNGGLGSTFNQHYDPDWNNGFSIQRNSNPSNDFANGAATIENHKYASGDVSRQFTDPNSYSVVQGDAGKSVDERAITSLNSLTQTTPGQVTFTSYNLGDVNINPKWKIASARVPYNFEIDAGITTNEETPIYAGEETFLNYNLDIKQKNNAITTNDNSSYATNADQVRRQLVIYNPNVVSVKNGGIMSGGRNTDVCSTYFGHIADQANCGYGQDDTSDYDDVPMAGKKYENLQTKFYAQDSSAGTRICAAMAVFPANSGADTNWNDKEYSRSWRISDSKCYTIAKKPSVQVWGGNVYSGGKITTETSIKRNLSGYTEYKVNEPQGTFAFGSWNELGVISNGQVKGFSSGASLGYGGISNGILSPDPFTTPPTGNTTANAPNPGGSKYSSNCNRSPLTFANDCSGNTTSSIGNSIAVNNAKTDKSALISKYIYGGDASKYNVSGRFDIDIAGGEAKDGIIYYYGEGDLILDEAQIGASTTKIVHAKDNIIIDGNLNYDKSTSYMLLSSLPKLVVYAKNIAISCNVTRIDAVLIADENVVTCNNFEGEYGNNFMNKVKEHINDQVNSNQLVINGAVIADKLIANRTYGAATGANSIVPAEIINFDPSLYLWGGEDSISSEGRNTNMDMTYSRELPPRF